MPSVIIHSESQPKLVLRNLTKNIFWFWSSFPLLSQVIEKSDNIRLAQITCQILAVFFMSAGFIISWIFFFKFSSHFLYVRRWREFIILYFLLLIPRICPPFGTHGRPLVGGLPGIPIARWVRLHHVSVEAIFNCSLNFDLSELKRLTDINVEISTYVDGGA